MKFLTLSIFSEQPNLLHAIFNRHGGLSKAPFDSLNNSFGVGDDPLTVYANRKIIQDSLHLDILKSVRQIHSDRVLIVRSKPTKDLEEEGYDALITDVPNLGLLIQQADCQAVMLYDPCTKVIANIHAGWKGATVNIIRATIRKMTAAFGTVPADILAGISPSLGPCCAEFIHYQTELPFELHKYQKAANHFDFWAISRDQLIAEGVEHNRIEIAKICTRCNQDYFSYRREKTTGRCGSIIALR